MDGRVEITGIDELEVVAQPKGEGLEGRHVVAIADRSDHSSGIPHDGRPWLSQEPPRAVARWGRVRQRRGSLRASNRAHLLLSGCGLPPATAYTRLLQQAPGFAFQPRPALVIGVAGGEVEGPAGIPGGARRCQPGVVEGDEICGFSESPPGCRPLPAASSVAARSRDGPGSHTQRGPAAVHAKHPQRDHVHRVVGLEPAQRANQMNSMSSVVKVRPFSATTWVVKVPLSLE